MKETERDRKGWTSPYQPSPKLPAQRGDTHRGHQIETGRRVTDRTRKER